MFIDFLSETGLIIIMWGMFICLLKQRFVTRSLILLMIYDLCVILYYCYLVKYLYLHSHMILLLHNGLCINTTFSFSLLSIRYIYVTI